MGDRCNIVVRGPEPKDDTLGAALDGAVVFYGHWAGEEMPERLKRALDRHQRWDDTPYLARIIFCEFIKGNEADEHGFGISVGHLCDNERPVMVVCTDTQTVSMFGNDSDDSSVYKRWSFADFPGTYATK